VYAVGDHVVLTKLVPAPRIPRVGVVTWAGKLNWHIGDCDPDLYLTVRVKYGDGRHKDFIHMPPDHVRPAEWCEVGQHWGPGTAEDDYMCLLCRDAA
jgi:hypothetical protein